MSSQTPTSHEVREMVERTAPSPPPEPTSVVVGGSGNPLIVGLPIFAVGSLALGMALVGVVDATALGAVIPIVLFATGLYLLVCTAWAALLGQTIVAGICGTFSGFWLSFGMLLFGLTHNWYGILPIHVAKTEELFFIAWACLFVFLLIPCLLLPVVYPLVVGLVVAALALAATSAANGDPNVLKAAGYVILVFAFLGFYAFVHVGLEAMGAKRPFPPLGPVPLGARG